jgi:hypothetical protein
VTSLPKHPLAWFEARIGKRIYRVTKAKCPCAACAEVYKDGLVIADEGHAGYLDTIQSDLDMRYADFKEPT